MTYSLLENKLIMILICLILILTIITFTYQQAYASTIALSYAVPSFIGTLGAYGGLTASAIAGSSLIPVVGAIAGALALAGLVYYNKDSLVKVAEDFYNFGLTTVEKKANFLNCFNTQTNEFDMTETVYNYARNYVNNKITAGDTSLNISTYSVVNENILQDIPFSTDGVIFTSFTYAGHTFEIKHKYSDETYDYYGITIDGEFITWSTDFTDLSFVDKAGSTEKLSQTFLVKEFKVDSLSKLPYFKAMIDGSNYILKIYGMTSTYMSGYEILDAVGPFDTSLNSDNSICADLGAKAKVNTDDNTFQNVAQSLGKSIDQPLNIPIPYYPSISIDLNNPLDDLGILDEDTPHTKLGVDEQTGAVTGEAENTGSTTTDMTGVETRLDTLTELLNQDVVFDAQGAFDTINNKLGLGPLNDSLNALQNFSAGNYEPPKYSINFRNKMQPIFDIFQINNYLPDKEYTFVDFSKLEDYEVMGMTLLNLLHTVLDMTMILSTVFYIRSKLINKEVIS